MGTTTAINDLVVFRNSQGTAARGSLLKISRSALIMEVYNPYSIVQLSEVLQGLEVRRGERVVYSGRGVVSNLVNTGLMLIVSVRLMDGWCELAGLLDEPQRVRAEAEGFVSEWKQSHRILPEYQVAVSRLRGFLTDLFRWIEHVDEQERGDEGALLDDLCAALLPELNRLFGQFESAASQVAPEECSAHIRYAQGDLHPLLLRAPFVHRAYSKPLGYAGDYQMVNMMLSAPYQGPTVYARIVNALYLQAGPPSAHRNRVDILERWLAEAAEQAERSGQELHTLNVGCGPALELQKLLRSCPFSWRYRLELMDFNEETLAHVRAALTQAAGQGRRLPRIEYLHASVHQLLRQAAGRQQPTQGPYNMIYCAGLFDYLSDKICSRLLRLFYQWLRPGGRILVTNVHTNNANVYSMEHLLEWHLIHRDEQQMTGLVPGEWIQRVFVDATGMNVFMELGKAGASRLD